MQRSCKLQQPLANYRAAFARRRSGVRILLLEGELDEAQGRSLASLALLWQIRRPRFAQGGAAALAEGLRHRGGAGSLSSRRLSSRRLSPRVLIGMGWFSKFKKQEPCASSWAR